MPFDSVARVTEVEEVARGTYRLVMDAPDIAAEAGPGQFAMVGYSAPVSDPFLRRPLSFAGAKWGRIEFLIRVVGWGTALIGRLRKGDSVPVLGPLGEGFPKSEGFSYLVAGGIGLPPLLFARERWSDTLLIYGERTAEFVCDSSGEEELSICTEDGTLGAEGLVTETLLSHLDKRPGNILACGPIPMLREVAKIAGERKLECFVSLEERMACGVGACQGCAVKTRDGYLRVCKDGPVFPAEDIIWEDTHD